jgi:glycyl-tRNA synthetase beta chain
MAPDAIVLHSPDDYVEALRQARVVVDFGERMEIIRRGLIDAASSLNGEVVIDEKLLEEVAALVEWPVVLTGSFDDHFLATPKEVLISAMKTHQRYFHVNDRAGSLISSFLVVANIESSDPRQVIAGNEKVIRPRLADAAFFYDLDCRTTLEGQLERLKGVVFQAQLGTYFDRAKRIASLAGYLARQLGFDPETAARAGLLCKADLVTNLVNEFPDLQGIMGSYYAANDGEEAQVCAGIREQYLPAFSGDALPESALGRVVSLGEKFDTLVGLFGIDQPPTGSRDPFGLRRAAIGVFRIIVEGELDIDLREVLDFAASLFAPREFSIEPLLDYILERLNFWHQEQGMSPEVFQAVINCAPMLRRERCDLKDLDRRMRAVDQFRKGQSAVALSEANKRVSNILLKYAGDEVGKAPDPERMTETAERTLHAEIGQKQIAIAPLLRSGDYLAALEILSGLQSSIDRFFDEVLVMDENRDVRRNRIALLNVLREQFLAIADVSQLHTV